MVRNRTRRRYWVAMATAFAIVFPGAAVEGSELGLEGLGLAARFVDPGGESGTVGIGALVDLGGFNQRFRLEGRTDYWSVSENVAGGKASARDIAVGARGKYVFPVSHPRILPFAGAGLGIHFLHAEAEIAEQNFGGLVIPATKVEGSATKLGVDIGGGMNYSFNTATSLVSELWFTLVDGNADMSLGVGLLWHLGGSNQMEAQ